MASFHPSTSHPTHPLAWNKNTPVSRIAQSDRLTEGLGCKHLDDANLVGNIQRIKVGRQPDVGLLLAIGADEGVDLAGLDVVQLGDGLLDLVLVGADVDDEDQGVVVLDLLERRLGRQRVLDDAESIQARLLEDAVVQNGEWAGDKLLALSLARFEKHEDKSPAHAVVMLPADLHGRNPPPHPHSTTGPTLSTHLTRGYLGSRVRLKVFGRRKVTEYRGLRVFAIWLFFTAFAALRALDLSPASGAGEAGRDETS